MYQSLEVIKGHRFIKMNSLGVISLSSRGGSAIVDVLGRKQDIKQIQFGGFMEAGNVVNLTNVGIRCALFRIKIINIRNIYSDPTATKHCYTIPPQHYVVGNYFESKAFVLLYNGELKHFPLPPKEKTANVISIF